MHIDDDKLNISDTLLHYTFKFGRLSIDENTHDLLLLQLLFIYSQGTKFTIS